MTATANHCDRVSRLAVLHPTLTREECEMLAHILTPPAGTGLTRYRRAQRRHRTAPQGTIGSPLGLYHS